MSFKCGLKLKKCFENLVISFALFIESNREAKNNYFSQAVQSAESRQYKLPLFFFDRVERVPIVLVNLLVLQKLRLFFEQLITLMDVKATPMFFVFLSHFRRSYEEELGPKIGTQILLERRELELVIPDRQLLHQLFEVMYFLNSVEYPPGHVVSVGHAPVLPLELLLLEVESLS